MNKCGKCTLCCEIFPVNWLNKPANTACKHCESGCLIHETKPHECTDFNCAYIESNSNIKLRPDNCGIIFEKFSDKLIYGTLIKTTKEGKQQVEAFNNQGFSVILSSPKEVTNLIFINSRHNKSSIIKELKNKLKSGYGNPQS